MVEDLIRTNRMLPIPLLDLRYSLYHTPNSWHFSGHILARYLELAIFEIIDCKQTHYKIYIIHVPSVKFKHMVKYVSPKVDCSLMYRI